jgi:uncharacterized protein YneF (UPF0154 family)
MSELDIIIAGIFTGIGAGFGTAIGTYLSQKTVIKHLNKIEKKLKVKR